MDGNNLPDTSVVLEASVTGHVLALVDRASVVIPDDTEVDPPAAAVESVLFLRCGGSDMHAMVHLQRCDAEPGAPAPPPLGVVGERESVRLAWRLASGQLDLDQLHHGSTRVPDIGLTAGEWGVEVEVWGRAEAAAYEEQLEQELADLDEAAPLPTPASPLGPEVWRVRIWPASNRPS
jgi:hypothetical protein